MSDGTEGGEGFGGFGGFGPSTLGESWGGDTGGIDSLGGGWGSNPLGGAAGFNEGVSPLGFDGTFAGLGYDIGLTGPLGFGYDFGINPPGGYGMPSIGDYSGYQTGQWGDKAHSAYDPDYGRVSFGDSILETLKRLGKTLGTRALGRHIGPLAGPLVAGLTAPEGKGVQNAGKAFAEQTINGMLMGIPGLGVANALAGLATGHTLGSLATGMMGSGSGVGSVAGAGAVGGTGNGGAAGTGGGNGYGAALSILSGIDGMRQARAMQNSMAPFDQYRGGYGARAASLENDPRQLMRSPGYRAGLQATQRALAAQGYTGSGNAAVRIAEFGNDFFNRESDRLTRLAGAGAAPGAGAIPSAALRGQSLASMAYGLTPLFDYFTQGWGE